MTAQLSAKCSHSAHTWRLREAVARGFISSKKVAWKELLKNLEHYKSTLANLAGRGMTTEGRSFWEEKGNLQLGLPWRRLITSWERAYETWGADTHLKSLEANRGKLVDLTRYMEECPKEKGEEKRSWEI
jgi:hypothetical protein